MKPEENKVTELERKGVALNKRLIWKKKFKEEACISVWGTRKCVTAELELTIYQNGATYTLEARLGSLGNYSYGLSLDCFKESRGPLSFEICIKDIKFRSGKLVRVRMTAELCIGTKIGPFEVEKCWNVLDTTIQLFTLEAINSSQSVSIMDQKLAESMDSYGIDEAYVEIDNSLISN